MSKSTKRNPQTTLRVSHEFAELVALVAKSKRISIHSYLDTNLLPQVKRQSERFLRERLAELGGEGG